MRAILAGRSYPLPTKNMSHEFRQDCLPLPYLLYMLTYDDFFGVHSGLRSSQEGLVLAKKKKIDSDSEIVIVRFQPETGNVQIVELLSGDSETKYVQDAFARWSRSVVPKKVVLAFMVPADPDAEMSCELISHSGEGPISDVVSKDDLNRIRQAVIEWVDSDPTKDSGDSENE